MEVFHRVYDDIRERRERILSGKVNCIPCPFVRFSEEFPGIERGKYYGITAQQKVGKTQLTDYMFLYAPFFYALEHPEEVRIKIFYFSLELSAEDKYKQFICHLLFVLSKGEIRVSPRDLNSTKKDQPLDPRILEILNSEQYRRYYEFFEKKVKIISDIRNPTGIYKFMKEYAKAHGKSYTKTMSIKNKETGDLETVEVFDYYQPDDPEEYVICIVDHIGLITPESGMTLHQSISKLSAEYFVNLRNNYKQIPVIVQQQALAGESLENAKMGKLKPSVTDLGENKLTSRDVNTFLGLFSPFKTELHDYLGYNIDYFRDNIRFLEIMISREGGGGTTCPLFFDGATNYFKELPKPGDPDLVNAKILIEKLRKKT